MLLFELARAEESMGRSAEHCPNPDGKLATSTAGWAKSPRQALRWSGTGGDGALGGTLLQCDAREKSPHQIAQVLSHSCPRTYVFCSELYSSNQPEFRNFGFSS